MSALKALNPNNLPTQALESWKFTNISRVLPGGLIEDIAEHVSDIHSDNGARQNIVFMGEDGKHQKPRLNITVKRGESLTLIETQEGQGAYWKNMVTEITLEEGAKCEHIRFQNESMQAVSTNMVHMTLGRDSIYNGFAFNIGGKLTRHDIHAEIKGENASCSFNGINLLHEKQHGDTTILIEHQAPHCQSNQFYRSLVDDNARCVFQGKVHVHQVAQKTDAYQLSNTLLLSDKAEMDTKPELEIYADDVKCSHGSTVGQMDEEPLFYLRSRGLKEADARLLLSEAYVAEVIEKIVDQDSVTHITERAKSWLQSVL